MSKKRYVAFIEKLKAYSTTNFISFFTSFRGELIKSFPQDFTSRSTDVLCQAFKGFPSRVEVLDVSKVYFGNRTASELAAIFSSIPEHITELCLSGVNLDNKTEEELHTIFQGLPETIKSLQLTSLANEYEHEDNKDPNWNEEMGIDLKWKDFKHMSTSQLKTIFAALPANVKEIELDYYDIRNRSKKDLIILGQALAHVEKLHVNATCIVHDKGEMLRIGTVETREIDNDPVRILKSHMGSWNSKAHEQLLPQLPPVIAEVVMSYLESDATPCEPLKEKDYSYIWYPKEDTKRNRQEFFVKSIAVVATAGAVLAGLYNI